MGYNVNMRIRKSTIRCVATLGLTTLFTVLTIFVQGPHQHPANDPGPGHATCVIHGHGPDASACIDRLSPLDPSQREAYSDFGYCLACLFLKTCKERAVARTSPIPVLSLIKYVSPSNDLRCTSLIVISSSPRAPPVSII